MPPGTAAIPPPLDGLKPAPSLKAELARKVARGTDTPTSAVNAAAADLPSAPPTDRYPEGNASQREYQMHEVREQGQQLLAELLARAELAEEQCRERDAAMEILTVRTGALVSRARVLHIRSRVAGALRGFRHQDPSHA